MEYPKSEAFKVVFKTLDQAVQWATSKRKFGGCFLPENDQFVVYWLPKGHKDIQNFKW